MDKLEQEVESKDITDDKPISNEKISVKMPPKKYSKKKLLIIGVSIICGLIIIASVMLFFVLNQPKPKAAIVNKKTESKIVETPKSDVIIPEKIINYTNISVNTPADVMTNITGAITSIYPNVIQGDQELIDQQISFSLSKEAPYYKVFGKNVFANYTDDGAQTISIKFPILRPVFGTPEYEIETSKMYAMARNINNAIYESLKSQGFDRQVSIDSPSGQAGFYIYNDIVCNNSDADNMSPPLILSCGNVSKYTVSLDSYIAAEPFVQSYMAAGNDIFEGEVFHSYDSRINNGFDLASVSHFNATEQMGGHVLLYYRKSTTKDWTYFTGTQGIIGCDKYNTDEIKAAYQNDSCGAKSESGSYIESTVQ